MTVNLASVSAVDANIAWAAGRDRRSVLLHTTTGGVIPPPTITSVMPASGVENAIVDVTNLAGANFQDGATVRIVGASKTVDATGVNVISSTRITCKLNLTGAPRASTIWW